MGHDRSLADRGQRTDRGPAALAVSGHPMAAAGPIHAFTRLVNGLAERDQPAVDKARRELRRRGYDVRMLGTPPRGGGR
jgi:hypothetical protein